MLKVLGIINIQALLPEGFEMTSVYIFTGIAVIYLIVRPVANWIVSLQSIKLLSYMMSSLLLLVFFLSGMALTTSVQIPLSLTLRCLAVFGGCLVIIHFLQYLFQNIKRRT